MTEQHISASSPSAEPLAATCLPSMRYLVFACFLSSMSCSQINNSGQLYGSWRTVSNPTSKRTSLKDSMVFEKPDILKIYNVWPGVTTDSIVGKFYTDSTSQYLTTQYDTLQFKFKIINLTENSLIIENLANRSRGIFQRLKWAQAAANTRLAAILCKIVT